VRGAKAALPATGPRVVPRGAVGAVAVGVVILDGLRRAMALLTVLHRAAHCSTGWRDAGRKGGGGFRADLRKELGDEGGSSRPKSSEVTTTVNGHVEPHAIAAAKTPT
jgi:hypothetical protein